MNDMDKMINKIINIMAFVSQSSRFIEERGKDKVLGPGSYEPITQAKSNTNCNYAPFASTTNRRSLIQEKDYVPGPGTYSLNKYNNIQNNVIVYQNNKNTIVTIKSLGTASFKSVIQRFAHTQPDLNLGPGQYIDNLDTLEVKSNQKIRKKYFFEHHHTLQKLIQDHKNHRKNWPSIPTKTFLLKEKMKEIESREKAENSNSKIRSKSQEVKEKLGPGYYENTDSIKKKQKLAVWGKDKSIRFKTEQTNDVGPGKYESILVKNQKSKSKYPSSSFISNTIKSHFDEIYYKTNIKEMAEIRHENKFKSSSPAPGQYNYPLQTIASLDQSEKYKNHSFGTEKRFSTEPKVSNLPFYNYQSDFQKNNSFSRGAPAFLSDCQRSQCLILPTSINPGPGQYDGENYNPKKQNKNNIELFGSMAERKFQVFKNSIPHDLGPGSYNTEQSTFKKLNQKHTMNVFRPNLERPCLKNLPTDNLFGKYDAFKQEISRKAEQKRNHIENLRHVQVIKPPFEKSTPRFQHYEEPSTPKRARTLSQENKFKVAPILQQIEKERLMKIAENQEQVLNLKKCSFQCGSPRFRTKKGGPGVGDYSIRNRWDKKSYNIKYSNRNKTQI